MGRVVGTEGAGEGVAFAAGDVVAFGFGDALGLGADVGDFFVAAKAASGVHRASTPTPARRICSLFFMVGDVVRFRF
jgi:hypothetical protein